jgi:GT2 family glycosyltransferase
LETCLASLYKQFFKDFSIIVIDNASSDSSVHFIKEVYPNVQVIQLESNFGFAKAVNIGIKSALNDFSTEYILLLNNDIETDENFLQELLNGFISSEIGSVACKMLNYYSRNIIDDTGNFIKPKGSPFMRGHGELDEGQYDSPEYIFGACGGAVLYKKVVFERVGYFEDVDFSFRLQYSGYKCYYNPKAICYHKRGGTISSYKKMHIYLLERNKIILRIQNYPFVILLKYCIYYQLSRIYNYIKLLITGSPILFFYAVKGYISGIFEIPIALKKRKTLFISKKVSSKYIKWIISNNK